MPVNKIGSNMPAPAQGEIPNTTASSTAKTSTSTTQSTAATQPPSSDVKASKATESQISGETMRLALQESLKSASALSFTDLIGSTYPVAEKKVETSGWA